MQSETRTKRSPAKRAALLLAIRAMAATGPVTAIATIH